MPPGRRPAGLETGLFPLPQAAGSHDRRVCPGLPHCPAVAPGPGPPGTKERSGGSVFHLKIDKGDFPAASVAVATAAQVTAAVQVQPLAGELLRASGVAAEKQEMKS